ncbi:FAD:protein FMN transferase [Aestuariivirga litoralis]|uniref:FAD:protein FMN transferase n=1 Tax=Aestuariivirga litoralis TaxID=2650924 RepID=UPI0018C52DC4|nr:FAD:protein FMN transferase [Aestuariivirga litoralis]MBG1230799.1 FAD:protein FMN transferase [Aestuariivirga litoralis]
MNEDTRIVMGMPVAVSTVDGGQGDIDRIFDWFGDVDQRFSLYKADSEISRFNAGKTSASALSADLRDVLDLAERTRQESHGYFDAARPSGGCDPTGIVKGWAIKKAAQLFDAMGVMHYCINAGGDIQSQGVNGDGEPWRVGISSPFQSGQIIKILAPRGAGVATSGSYVRGHHIWNPHAPAAKLSDIVSITVVGRDILEADRFATAAFAMGKDGIYFIEGLPGVEAYQIDASGGAIQTSAFDTYVIS